MSIRTDLAAEAAQHIKKTSDTKLDGITACELKKGGFDISRITVDTPEASEKLSKPMGKYVTLYAPAGLESYPDDFNEKTQAIAEELIDFGFDLSDVLVAGLGNVNITPDSLGAKTAAGIFATRHIKLLAPHLCTDDMSQVSVLAAGVTGQTGIESAELIKAVTEKTCPSAVIVVDALACSDIKNLGRTIQLTDTGISPGSGVDNARKEISRRTLGVDVIALGVPMVADMETLAEYVFGSPAPENHLGSMMVTPRTIDLLSDRAAKLISMAVNRALQPSLSVEEITSLTE